MNFDLFKPDVVIPEPEHWLIVAKWADHPDADLFDVVHPSDCPLENVGPEEGPSQYQTYACVVGEMVSNAGLDSYFQHADDKRPDMSYTDRVGHGRYRIEPWFETYRGFEYTEYDSGLRVVT